MSIHEKKYGRRVFYKLMKGLKDVGGSSRGSSWSLRGNRVHVLDSGLETGNPAG